MGFCSARGVIFQEKLESGTVVDAGEREEDAIRDW